MVKGVAREIRFYDFFPFLFLFLNWKYLSRNGWSSSENMLSIHFLFILGFPSCKVEGSTNRNSQAENEANG